MGVQGGPQAVIAPVVDVVETADFAAS